MQEDFAKKIEAEFDAMIRAITDNTEKEVTA
jgi:hypothetical protein